MTDAAVRVARAAGVVALAAALSLAPLFGGVERDVWSRAAWTWIGCALIAGLPHLRRWPLSFRWTGPFHTLFFALHATCALQLVPLPPTVARALGPGSYFAQSTPSDASAWMTLTVSREATLDAWFWIVGLHALYNVLTNWLQAFPNDRRRAIGSLVAVGFLLGVQALVQRRSIEPYWLYGLVPIDKGHEKGITGPFYNRNAFAGFVALAAPLALGLALHAPTAHKPRPRPKRKVGALLVSASIACLVVASIAASGSRSGLAAAVTSLVFVLLRGVPSTRARAATLGMALTGLALLTAANPLALARTTRIDAQASRLAAWKDMTRLWTEFPWAGHGLGAFGAAYRPYQSVFRYEYWPHAHNEYLEVSFEVGAAGVLALSLALVACCIKLRRSQVHLDALGALVPIAVLAITDFPLRVPATAAAATLLVAALPRHASD